jgi:hypothetical protein
LISMAREVERAACERRVARSSIFHAFRMKKVKATENLLKAIPVPCQPVGEERY